MKTTIVISLTEKLKKHLDDIAKETKKPQSFHIQKALEAYIEKFADLRIAIDRLRNPKDEIVSGKGLIQFQFSK